MILLLDHTLKVSLILLISLIVASAVRRRSAAVRHWVLAVGIMCAAATPVLAVVAPAWHVRLSVFPAISDVERTPPAITTSLAFEQFGRAADSVSAPVASGRSRQPTAAALLKATWIAGAGASLFTLVVGLVRLRWLSSRGRRVGRRWSDRAIELSRAVGLRRPVLVLQCNHPTLLATWGLRRPTIILPAAAAEWSDDRMSLVLRHEMAHIRRGDWIVQIVGELLRSLFWFDPLVWIVCTRLRQESEYACDDAVLGAGVDGREYASHLLDLARMLGATRRAWLPAAAMARPSSLEGRISAMLNTNVNRTPLTRSTRFATVIALFSLTVPLAGLAAQTTFSTLSGTVLDQTNRFIPNATLALTDTARRARHEVRSDGTGRFEFVGLPPAEYVLEVKQIGFAPFTDTITIGGRNIDRTIQLQLGSVHETITIANRAGEQPAVAPEKLQQLRLSAQDARQRALARCSSADRDQIGGNILAPRKLTDVKVIYPEDLKQARIEGIVTMDALIGTDGMVHEIKAISSPHPGLERAAIDAVRLWEFSPTLLNCTPMEVPMHVTTNFIIQQ